MAESGDSEQCYRPLSVFSEETTRSPGACLVLLNCELNGLEAVLERHWHKFSLHICADGGANRLFDTSEEGRAERVPHTICGDLDSARADVLDYYGQKGTRVARLEDQDSTDFTKAVREALSLRRRGLAKFSSIYTMNAFGGRFDQTLGTVQTVMALDPELCGTPVYLVSEDSIAVLVTPSESSIAVDTGLESGHCGLLPIGEPCDSCTTTGLQWNLRQQAMRFGGLISTCNLLDRGCSAVHVTASSPLLWTMSHKLCCSASATTRSSTL